MSDLKQTLSDLRTYIGYTEFGIERLTEAQKEELTLARNGLVVSSPTTLLDAFKLMRGSLGARNPTTEMRVFGKPKDKVTTRF